MAILVLEPDVNGRAQASIEKSAARHAEVGRLLTYVSHEIDMPLLLNPEEAPLPCREPVDETTAVSTHFSSQIHALYEQLAAYHARSAASLGEANPKLAPIDEDNGVAVEVRIRCQSFDRYPHCLHLIYHTRRLTLQRPETLPALPFVRKLRVVQDPDLLHNFYFGRARPVSLRVLLECLVRLPGVAEIDCPWLWEWFPVAAAGRPMRHFTRVWEGPWRDARHEFGTAITEKQEEGLLGGLRVPTTLTKARLWFWQPRLVCEDDQALPMPDLVAPAQQDPLSVGLCLLAAQLQELNLRAFVTEHLFPVPDAPSSEQWSHMQRLTIEFHPLRPDGSWYFVGPRGEDPHPAGFGISEEVHYPPLQTTAEDESVDEQWDEDPQGGEEAYLFPDVFRTEPLAERIEPLLAGFAAAVKNMPALEDAELFAYLAWHPSESRAGEYGDEAPYDRDNGVHKWGVRYLAAGGGRDSEKQRQDQKQAVVQWKVDDWRPSQNVLDLFEGLGRQEWLNFEFEHQRHIIPYTVA